MKLSRQIWQESSGGKRGVIVRGETVMKDIHLAGSRRLHKNII
ncbi:MAG: hypothetical protein ACP5OU_09780 [Methanothrix sp.]